MLAEPLPNLRSWSLYLENYELPVLSTTTQQISTLLPEADHLTAKTLSQLILNDPLMTVHVLRKIQKKHNQIQKTPITTVSHALMMQGIEHFFHDNQQLQTVEEHLKGHTSALQRMNSLVSRARTAANLANLWGKLRHDMESDELTIAALLHDLSEILLCLVAPQILEKIYHLQKNTPGLRSQQAQTQILGFTLQQLQLELISAWKLPELLKQLMNDAQDEKSARAHIVILATRVARHLQYGWEDPALPDDYSAIATLTGQPIEKIADYLKRILVLK